MFPVRAFVNEVIKQTRYMHVPRVSRVCMTDMLEHLQLKDWFIDSILVVVAVCTCCADF